LVSRVRMVVLNDNEPGEGLINEWGWSVYLESDKWRILFDADTDPRVIEHNSRVLGVDLSRIDFAVLSHHHGDHSGGFEYVGRVKPGVTVYVPPGSTSYLKHMGLKPVVIEEPVEIAPDAWSTGPLRPGLWGISEHALAVKINGLGLLLVVGCSHPGADKLAERAVAVTGTGIYMIIGGFHEPPRSVIDNLSRLAKQICPAHCSGVAAKEYTSRKYPDKYCSVRTGSIIELP